MKKKSCIIVAAFVVALVAVTAFALKQALTPWSLADRDPRLMVARFVCDPLVDSISEIKATGCMAFAGGNASISFRIDPEDLEALLKRGRFRPIDDKAPEWVRVFTPETGEEVAFRYLKVNEGTTESALFVSYGGKKCWFHEVQY
jgi:hypothetical protein